MFLTMAILFALAEIVILAIGKGGFTINGLILFIMFYALASQLRELKNLKVYRLRCKSLHSCHLHYTSRNYSQTGDLIQIA